MYAHFDRDADIAWFVFAESPDAVGVLVSEETDSGLIDRDEHGHIVGVEVWQASRRLPGPLLDALPAPVGDRSAVGREPVS